MPSLPIFLPMSPIAIPGRSAKVLFSESQPGGPRDGGQGEGGQRKDVLWVAQLNDKGLGSINDTLDNQLSKHGTVSSRLSGTCSTKRVSDGPCDRETALLTSNPPLGRRNAGSVNDKLVRALVKRRSRLKSSNVAPLRSKSRQPCREAGISSNSRAPAQSSRSSPPSRSVREHPCTGLNQHLAFSSAQPVTDLLLKPVGELVGGGA
jgi:hypothetical protein